MAVLWMLIQEKNVCLKDNPHFYKCLPTKSVQYHDDFCLQPLPFVGDLESITGEERLVLDVLTDRDSRLLVNCGDISRVFGNIWKPGITLLKGIFHFHVRWKC